MRPRGLLVGGAIQVPQLQLQLHSPNPHAAHKLHGSIFYRTGLIADQSFTLLEWGI